MGELYGRSERLHGKRWSAVSPSYTIGRSGRAERPDGVHEGEGATSS